MTPQQIEQYMLACFVWRECCKVHGREAMEDWSDMAFVMPIPVAFVWYAQGCRGVG